MGRALAIQYDPWRGKGRAGLGNRLKRASMLAWTVCALVIGGVLAGLKSCGL